jgi:hypothetical protein
LLGTYTTLILRSSLRLSTCMAVLLGNMSALSSQLLSNLRAFGEGAVGVASGLRRLLLL